MEDAWGTGNQSETRFTPITTNNKGLVVSQGINKGEREWGWEWINSVRGEREKKRERARARDRWEGLRERGGEGGRRRSKKDRWRLEGEKTTFLGRGGSHPPQQERQDLCALCSGHCSHSLFTLHSRLSVIPQCAQDTYTSTTTSAKVDLVNKKKK